MLNTPSQPLPRTHRASSPLAGHSPIHYALNLISGTRYKRPTNQRLHISSFSLSFAHSLKPSQHILLQPWSLSSTKRRVSRIDVPLWQAPMKATTHSTQLHNISAFRQWATCSSRAMIASLDQEVHQHQTLPHRPSSTLPQL